SSLKRHPRIDSQVARELMTKQRMHSGLRKRTALNHSAHLFWPDDTSIVDAQLVSGTRVHSARQITGTYLLAPAQVRGGRPVTFKSAIALAAVKGATARQRVTLV
ncbi:MAG: hypothetical protein ACTS6J_20050, partial [Burkholderiales bacterium]